jgi:branched-chain amino acid transport system ATP-binding protein
MGVAPRIVAEIFALLADLNRLDLAILPVEQNARRALALAGRGHVPEGGRIVQEGPAKQLAESPAIVDAYLGAAGSREFAA